LKAYKILEKKFRNLRLIVVGKGPQKKEMEEFVKENGLKEVVFEGQIKEDEVVNYYTTCDLFCSPATHGESFGLVLVEAMACQKPVVAFANEGYFQFLHNKKGGILVKNKDWRELAKKLEILIKNQKLREKMGKIALKEAEEYSWTKIADRVLDFYQFCQREKAKKDIFPT
jgi:phosphatidylinositol alpha-mannosyltransferase